MKNTKKNYFMCDFETTVYQGQETTEVWASAVCPFWEEEGMVFTSLPNTFAYFLSLQEDIIAYYHNLKFDGYFWLDFLYRNSVVSPFFPEGRLARKKEMPDNSFTYLISGKGQWYFIIIKANGHFIELRDSLKLLPFSVAQLGQSFGTKHKKLSMEYEGYRYAGCEITESEKQYILNDCYVVKEALEIMLSEGHDKLTIGACCLAEMKNTGVYSDNWDSLFPDLSKIECPFEGFENADAYFRKGYKGGWTYLAEEKKGKVIKDGFTADVNSEYPFVMTSQSPYSLPHGFPDWFVGEIPHYFKKTQTYYVRFKCRFYLKKDHLPTVQIKDNIFYDGHEWLKTSMFKVGDKYVESVKVGEEVFEARPTLTMCEVDFELFKKHYRIKNLEILDGAIFWKMNVIFDDYIDKYKKIKMNSTGAKRGIAKLFSNNGYGKLAASDESTIKIFHLDEEKDILKQSPPEEKHDRRAGHIACGAAITACARHYIISHAQKIYKYFCYADTDSLHAENYEECKDKLPIDYDKCGEYGLFKIENRWKEAKFFRPKFYLEVNKGYEYNKHSPIKRGDVCKKDENGNEYMYEDNLVFRCAGMPDSCKKNFLIGRTVGECFEDMRVGLIVQGKLRPKKIHGGIILETINYEVLNEGR